MRRFLTGPEIQEETQKGVTQFAYRSLLQATYRPPFGPVLEECREVQGAGAPPPVPERRSDRPLQ